jgi:hypothetical protein
MFSRDMSKQRIANQLVHRVSVNSALSPCMVTSPQAICGALRGVAQFGSASGLGPEGRRFESCLPDHFTTYSLKCLPSGGDLRQYVGNPTGLL